MHIQWRDRDTVGIPEIDQQHHRLMELINMLHLLCEKNSGFPVHTSTARLLLQSFRSHVKTEEALLQEAGAGIGAHQNAHDRQLEELAQICVDYENGHRDEEMLKRLKAWWHSHITSDLSRGH